MNDTWTRRSPLSAAALEAFRLHFGEAAIWPDSPLYENARKVWNAMIDRRPGLILMCSNVVDVVTAVRLARAYDVDVAVRGGGHNIAGRGVCDDGIVIDLSRMKAIKVDPARRVVEVQPGVTLGELDAATAPFDLAVPTGIAPPTGIAGLTLGGGIGWLTHKYGLTCDNLLRCEVVTAEGAVLTADKHENPDLFWALRGGGGNFGIVTSFEFQAHPVGKIFGGIVLHPRDHARGVLRVYRDLMAAAPRELTAYAGLMSAPDGTPVVAIAACYCGDLDEGKAVLQPLREFGHPIMDMMDILPFVEMQKLGYQPGNAPTHHYWRSVVVDELPDALIDLMIDRTNLAASPLSGSFIQFMGGTAERLPDEGTAFAHRQRRYSLGIEAQWSGKGEGDQHIAWARDLAKALEPFSKPGHILNFLNDEGESANRASFGENYERLRAIKTRYDPGNFFHHNQNILPLGNGVR